MCGILEWINTSLSWCECLIFSLFAQIIQLGDEAKKDMFDPIVKNVNSAQGHSWKQRLNVPLESSGHTMAKGPD